MEREWTEEKRPRSEKKQATSKGKITYTQGKPRKNCAFCFFESDFLGKKG